MDNVYESKDKQVVPFLLTQPEVKFLGTRLEDSVLYFQFFPLGSCQELVNDFLARQASPVDPKTLLDAVETFRDVVFGMKDERRKYGGKET